MRVVAVIPARFASTRLPGKPLSDIHGKPMIQWVYERVKLARGIDRVIVATDDEKVMKRVQEFGGEVMMTRPEIASGTDRVAAVADEVQADVYVNVQGDEPMIDPKAIEAALALVTSGKFPMGTAMTPMDDLTDLKNPAAVKVIADKTGRAIYFSRLPIPYGKQEGPGAGERPVCRKHVGLYVYTRDALMRFRSLPQTALERAEMLEQLRAIDDGIPIGVAEVKFVSIGVDTPEELEKARNHLKALV